MTANYIRSELYNYNELPQQEQERQAKELDHLTAEELDEERFIKDPCNPEEFLALSNFMRIDGNKFSHGIFGQTAFSAYFITMGRTGEDATIAYKHF